MKSYKIIVKWCSFIILIFIFSFFAIIFGFQPICIEGNSMQPTFENKDKVLVSKLYHTFKIAPNYGDIVVFDTRIDKPHSVITDIVDFIIYNQVLPLTIKDSEEIYCVKRVIGKPGDSLEFLNNKVLRNGEVINEPYIKIFLKYDLNMKITVPQNQFFVMGDNRNNSIDSRKFGCIPLDHIIGKCFLKFDAKKFKNLLP